MMSTEIRRTLSTLADPQGGWGYAPQQPPHIEPTVLALFALASERDAYRETLDRAFRFLDTQLLRDGSYRLGRGRPEAVWPTSLVLLAKQLLQPDDSINETVKCLLRIEGRVVENDPEVANMLDINTSRIGWPWAVHNFAWVEPTAWAIIALRICGRHREPRVLEGMRLLLDRAFDSGGVNYGNRIVLGLPTEPLPINTALMLIALQGCEPHPRIEAARRFLREKALETGDLEQLSWAKLALSVDSNANREELTSTFDPLIHAAYEQALSNGRAMAVHRHALAAIALSCDTFHPFRFSNGKAAIEGSELDLAKTPPPKQPQRVEGKSGFWGRLKSGYRTMMVRGLESSRVLPEPAGVHIARAASYEANLVDILKSQFDHYRKNVAIKNRRVVLKPNLVEYHRDKVVNTDPRFVDAVIQFCKDEGAAEIVLAEGPGHWRNIDYILEASSFAEVLRKHDIRFVDLNHDEPVKSLNVGRLTGLEFLYLSRTTVEADVLISLPKLKTHHWAGATLSLKNLFGIVPGICYGWPKNELHWRGIPNSIIDIALTRTPELAIVDGIIGMEGDGPLNGTPRQLGVIVMGADLVAVDATCCRLMKLPPERLPTLYLGEKKKLGRLATGAIPMYGERIEEIAQEFAWPPLIEKQMLRA